MKRIIKVEGVYLTDTVTRRNYKLNIQDYNKLFFIIKYIKLSSK